jgi:hypothetical protein
VAIEADGTQHAKLGEDRFVVRRTGILHALPNPVPWH